MRIIYMVTFGFLLILIFWGCEKDSNVVTDPHPDWTYDPTAYVVEYPETFPAMQFDEDNPMTEEGVALGRMLYYDTLLHATGLTSCASCHLQSNSFTSATLTNPSILPHINLGWNTSYLWNGKVTGNIEDIMLFEVEDFFVTDLNKFNDHESYPKLFYEAFGVEEISSKEAANAIAQFVRTIVSSDSHYDQVLEPGSSAVLTDEQFDGYDIFFTEKGDCFHCHGGILYTDNLFHNNGLDAVPSQNGLSQITGDTLDIGKFKTPTLRNIELTAPYMHDGRYQTLEEVIDFYSEGVQNSPTIDPLMKQAYRGGIHLTSYEKTALISFLKILTDTTITNNPAFSDPF